MKFKSSFILGEALKRILDGSQQYACAAIQSVETDLRFEHQENVTSKASSVFAKYRPQHVKDNVKDTQNWWPKGDALRVVAIESAIKYAASKGD